jgi:3'-phosphoadenosine 5'-phosphosulfate sulfotransferase (PAPS reductase)/FAD synthetase
MKTTQAIIKRAFDKYRPALAFSGGGDSSVLLDIVYALGYRPPLVYSDSQMEYPETVEHVKAVARKYALPLTIAKAPETPPQRWQKTGFPMLGKMAARIWMQNHRRDKNAGIKIDVSTCCRKMKIEPGRKAAKALGCNAQMTGQRGGADDRLRGMRAHLDGAFVDVKSDSLTVINPLLGWTDLMIRRYTENHALPVHPLKKAGAMTIGCIYCGGGAQFDNSGFRVLRKVDPESWRHMLKDYGFAPVILAIRYDCHMRTAEEAIRRLGGIDAIMNTMPHVFDFLRPKPLKGYDR